MLNPSENEAQRISLTEKSFEKMYHQPSQAASSNQKEVLAANSFDIMHQSSMIPEEQMIREMERKTKDNQCNRLKKLLIIGLAVMLTIALFLPLKQRIDAIEAKLKKSIEAQEARDNDSGLIVDYIQAKKKTIELPRKIKSWKSNPNSTFFEVPHLVWTYVQGDNYKNPFFTKKCLQNIKRFSAKSNFEFTILNESNYWQFVDKETEDIIRNVIQMLQDRMKKEPESNLKEHYEALKKRLIVFHVLNQNGGVYIDKNVFFVESLEWLKEIENSIHVNKGRGGKVKAKYFGFFNIDHGPGIQKFNKTGVTSQAEKYFVRLPTFQPYFFVAQPRQEFLTEFLVQYVEILMDPKKFREKFDRYGLYINSLPGRDIYFQVFYTCQLIVLARRQELMNKRGNKYHDNFSIDQFGFLTMNEFYFPRKLGFYFERYMVDKSYWNMARYSLTELSAIVGPIRYIVNLVEQDNLEIQLKKAREGFEKNYIHPESLLGSLIIHNSSQPYILKEYVRELPREKKIWDKLPKKIWQFWNSGLKNSTVGNQLCFDNLKRAAAKHNFQIIEVSDSNTEQYIGKELNDKIHNWLDKAVLTKFKQTKSDFVRIAIIAKYGGIYLDMSEFSVDGIEWILNIAQAPIQSISNRYGDLPKVLGSQWPDYNISFNQSYDKRANTNRQMLNKYENHMIVAEPNQQLLWNWLEEYGNFIITSTSVTERMIKELGMYGDQWTYSNNHYLAAMDSLRIVIAKKNKELQQMMDKDPNYNGPQSGAEYYGLWSVNSYRELQRFRWQTNFDNTYAGRLNEQHLYLWRYSHEYVEGIIGKVRHITKLYVWNIKELNRYLSTEFDKNFTELHPQSLVAKYLYLPALHKLTKTNGELSLELLHP